MSSTRGMFSQATANTDLSVFVGASLFKDVAGVATLASSAEGLYSLNLAANAAGSFFADLLQLLRTGMLATPALTQREFGTAAAQPGPSSVAGTSGPLALSPGFPPTLNANLSTIVGSVSGPAGKGIQINSVDVIYTVAGLAAALAQVGVTTTKFVNNVAPVVTNLIALAANGLPTPIQAQPYVKNVVVPTPVFVTSADTEVIAHVKLTAGATGTIVFYGINVNASFNFN